MGDWWEQMSTNDFNKKKTIIEKKLRLLSSQSLDLIRKKLYTPASKIHGKGYVVYGDPYQFVNVDFGKSSLGKGDQFHLSLAGTLNENEVRHSTTLSHDSQILATPTITPVMRNTFVLESANKCWPYKGNAVYEECIYIKMLDSAEPLYLSFYTTFLTLGQFNPVRLSATRDEHCMFKLVFWEPKTRYAKFRTIELNTRVLIKHILTGKNLMVSRSSVPTIFGREYEVTCDILRDSHKMETAESFWMIV